MSVHLTPPWIILAIASFCSGIVNVVAGGGGFLTFPALLLTGIDPRAANITSTVGLYPMQITSGYAERKQATGTPHLPFKVMMVISIVFGAVGAGLLLLTSPSFFGKLVPWLVLFATAAFAWGSLKKPRTTPRGKASIAGSVLTQILVSVYVGYYGGGAGIMMLAALTMAGMPVRSANAAKIILIAGMNTSALIIFLFSHDIAWMQALIIFVSSEIGAHVVGMRILKTVPEKPLRFGIIIFGLALSVWLFVRT